MEIVKTLSIFIAGALIFASALGGEAISIEDFKKLHSEDERLEAMDKAPPDVRASLMKIHVHSSLTEKWGEVGLKYNKEISVAQRRGFLALESLFQTQDEFFDNYLEALSADDSKKGISLEDQQKKNKELAKKYAAILKQFEIVHTTAYELAPSPAALTLERKVEGLNDLLKNEIELRRSNGEPVSMERLTTVMKQVDEVYREMESLPKLSPNEVRKEYDDFPEDLIYSGKYPNRFIRADRQRPPK